MASKNTSAQSGGGPAPLSDAKSQHMFQAAREFIRTCGDDPLSSAVFLLADWGEKSFPQGEEIILSLLHHDHEEIARPFGEERSRLVDATIRAQNYELTRLLLEAGVPLQGSTYDDPLGALFEPSPLSLNTKLLELLLSHGAKCKHLDIFSFRPLCLLGNEQWVRQALTDNEDFLLRPCMFDETGLSLSLWPEHGFRYSSKYGNGLDPAALNNSQRLHWIMDCVPAPLGIIGVFLDLNPPLAWRLSFVTALAAGQPEVAVAIIAREEQFAQPRSADRTLWSGMEAAANFGYPSAMQAILDRKDQSRCAEIRKMWLEKAQLGAFRRERLDHKAGLMVSGLLTPLPGGAFRLVCRNIDPFPPSPSSFVSLLDKSKSLVFYLDRRCVSATPSEEEALCVEARKKCELSP
ncbi:uncharacterized protein BO66DRAFT_388587 [Aspergillus aculeatinus CBS 121060]|uniref:Uncharacterized protein n=1 Tax=Aspergillus aculeatinus CBS 121060 TaxID=1448322 RepID=A0ACD1HK00_9EURO|nr:hypothetical protein BO66DRAFT_388587 [Aspergillus aculeatinus CBS 121060]RAH73953.1 hypothetical protein BO66DRAFT_388587 [Aspergillus aculeatinus CBS 121060]